MSYLDQITELSIQAQEVISRLAVIQAERSAGGDGSPKLRDQILRFTQLLSQSLNTSLTDEQRLKLLTRLVNDARLAEVPYYPYPPIEVTVAPTQRYVGDHNSLSNIQGDGFYHISAAQRALLLSAIQPSGLLFGALLGAPGDNTALAAALAGKEPVFAGSGNLAQFLNGNKVFAQVLFGQLGAKPDTLSGYGISASDTLFDSKYLQLGSLLTGLSTLTGPILNPSMSLIVALGSLQNQASSKEPALGNPSVNGYVLSSTTAGVRTWVAPGGGGGGSGTVTIVSVVSANGFAGSVATPGTTPAITLTTSVTGLLKGNGTAISAATAGTDYVVPGAITGSGLTMATARLLGRTTASTGAIEEISVAGRLTLSAGVLTGLVPTVNSSFTSQTTVTITHNLGYFPLVQAINGSGDLISPASVVHGSTNAFTVTFSTATTGNIIYA